MVTETFERSVLLPVSPTQAFDWHARLAAFDRLVPPWLECEIRSRPEALENGTLLDFRVRRGPFSLGWLARHESVVAGSKFVDVQDRGPFAEWRHEHVFFPTPDGCRLRDRICYRLPLGPLGSLAGGRRVRSDLEAMFAHRHFTTWHDLDLHRRWRRSLCLGLVSAGGPLSKALWAMLSTGGHHVEELRPDQTPPAWWGSLDALIDLEPAGRETRLRGWDGPVTITAFGDAPATVGGRHVHLEPAAMLGHRRWTTRLAGRLLGKSPPASWISVDDVAAAAVFALQTPDVEGLVPLASSASPLERHGFRCRHRDLDECRARYRGTVRRAFGEAARGTGSKSAVAVVGGG